MTITDNVSGFLITPGDILDLQNRLERLAGDLNLRNGIGSAGKEIIQQQYAKYIVLPILEKIYKDLY